MMSESKALRRELEILLRNDVHQEKQRKHPDQEPELANRNAEGLKPNFA
jgi:hypothetical protein